MELMRHRWLHPPLLTAHGLVTENFWDTVVYFHPLIHGNVVVIASAIWLSTWATWRRYATESQTTYDYITGLGMRLTKPQNLLVWFHCAIHNQSINQVYNLLFESLSINWLDKWHCCSGLMSESDALEFWICWMATNTNTVYCQLMITWVPEELLLTQPHGTVNCKQ